jgi:hypothetical protein
MKLVSDLCVLLTVPILGVYFLLTPVRPETGSSLEYAYEILSAVSSSFQGEGRIARYSFSIIYISKFLSIESVSGYRSEQKGYQQQK